MLAPVSNCFLMSKKANEKRHITGLQEIMHLKSAIIQQWAKQNSYLIKLGKYFGCKIQYKQNKYINFIIDKKKWNI